MLLSLLFLSCYLAGFIGLTDHGLPTGLTAHGRTDNQTFGALGGLYQECLLPYCCCDIWGTCVASMPPKRGSRGRKRLPKKACAVIPVSKQKTVYVDDTDEEAGELVETPDDDSDRSHLSVPTPEDVSPDQPCTSAPTEQKKKRGYKKHGLNLDQQAEVLEWFKSKPCLYDKSDRESMNTKYKELLKREQAEKMGIKCKFIIEALKNSISNIYINFIKSM